MGKHVICGVLIASSVAWVACNRPKTETHQAGVHQPAAAEGNSEASDKLGAVKAPGEAQVGDRTTCVVHPGPAFTVTESTPKAEFGGKTYYFCCSHCAEQFMARPSDYVK